MPVPVVVVPVAGSGFIKPNSAGYGIRFYGSTSGYVGIKPASAAGSVDYTLPSSAPASNGYALVGNTDGTTSWGLFASVSHSHSLSSLTASGASLGQVAAWDGSSWVPATVSAVPPSRSISTTSPLSGGGDMSADRTLSVGGLTGLGASGYFLQSTGAAWQYRSPAGVLSDIGAAASSHTHSLGDLTQSSATSGQVPSWNGSAWVATTISSASPGGSATEIQYRSGASSFGAVTGSAWDGTTLQLPKTNWTAASASTTPLTITGAASQSADLTQWNPNGVTAGYRARITSAGAFSCNGGVSTNECFGAATLPHASNNESTYLGGSITVATGDSITVVGYRATGGGSSSTNVGAYSSCSGAQFASAFGRGCRAGFYATAMGCGSQAYGSNPHYSCVIGYNNNGNYANCIVIGTGLTATATGQLLIGCGTGTTEGYIGNGITNATPVSFRVRATGGTGTNIAGGNFTVAPGVSTGSATPACIKLQGTTAGASGTTAQTLTDVLTITDAATITLADAVNVVLNTTTGTKIGTGTTQKLGFWGATPVAQQVLATGALHTIDDVISLLQTLGLCKQS